MIANSHESKSIGVDNYQSILEACHYAWTVDGYYLISGRREQTGDKRIYISVILSQVFTMLRSVIPSLVKMNLGFGMIKDPGSARLVLNGTLGAEHVGKVVIIFLSNEKKELLDHITTLLSKFSGPEVPNKWKIGNCLYGDYDKQNISRQKTRVQVLNQKYIVIQALSTRPKGDVMKAIFLGSLMFPQCCIIKEAKSHMISDESGRDMADRLKWQKDIFHKLQHCLPIPKVLELFQQDGNTYLVIENIKGKSLRQLIDCVYNKRTWPELSKRERGKLLLVSADIIRIVQDTHAQGFVHRDLSTANFLINRKGKIFLLDWELAFDFSNQFPLPPFGFGTPGFTSPEQNRGLYPTVEEDVFGLMALMIAIFTGARPEDLPMANDTQLLNCLNEKTQNPYLAKFLTEGVSNQPNRRPIVSEINAFISRQIIENNL